MGTDKLRIGVVGASGYAGTELLRLLHQHDEVQVSYVAGNHAEEVQWSAVRPYFPGYHHLQMQAYDTDVCLDSCDFVFVALPSGASGRIAVELWERGMRVIDLSGDLRLPAAEYERWYQQSSCPVNALEAAVYGLTEWNRDSIRDAQLLSNPGCYATAILLSLKPLAQVDGLNFNLPVVVDAKSGISGAGKKPKANFLHGELDANFYAYKVGSHQHTPEIERYDGLETPILLTTQLLPTARGIYANSYIQFSGLGPRETDIYQAYQSAYDNEPFITVHPPNEAPQLKHVRGSNYTHIGFHLDTRTRVLQVFSAIDNLQKGAAGQAVQNMNVMMGFDETAGLQALPLYP